MSALEKLGIKNLEVKNTYTNEQEQTKNAFAYQWSRRDSYESGHVSKFAREWLIERYCDNKESRLDELLSGNDKIIVDAGCGGGYSALALFGEKLNKHNYLGVDISDAVYTAQARFKEHGVKGDFLKSSVVDLPVGDETVDIIFSEGVLHHTDSTERSLLYLSKKLKKGGRFMFYVYAKKAPIREFTDDHIRNYLNDYSNEEAWKLLYPLTKLGIQLGKLNATIEIEEDIPYLEMKKGTYDLQRFFYWNICKAFYRPEFDFEEMNHMNYDWFRPLNCYRHTPDEVRSMCEKAGLAIEHINIQEAGITVVAKKI